MRLPALVFAVFFAAIPQVVAACAIVPGLSPLISYARTVELGGPVPPGATRAAAAALAAQDASTLSVRLQQAGLAGYDAPLQAFFGQLALVLDRALAGDMDAARRAAQSDAFGAAYTGARMAQNEICDTADAASSAALTAGGRPDRIGGDGRAGGQAGPMSPYETRVAINARRFVMVFVTLMSSLVIVHYALLWRASAARRRRLVSIPAVLRAGAEAVPGKLSVLELGGAKFVAAAPMRAPLTGAQGVVVEAAGRVFAVQPISGGRIAQHLVFKAPLELADHADLLAQSQTPPRRDPMARDRSTGAVYRYGQAHLPPSRDVARVAGPARRPPKLRTVKT